MDARGELRLIAFKVRDVDDEDSVTIGSVPEPVISIRRGVLGPFVGVDQVTVGGKEDVPIMRCRYFVLQGESEAMSVAVSGRMCDAGREVLQLQRSNRRRGTNGFMPVGREMGWDALGMRGCK